jgi:elongation factor 1-gamma
MKVLGQHGNVNTNKVLAAAEFLGQKVTFVHQETLKNKEFLAKNPLGKCPILESPNGLLTSSDAILRYLSSVAGQHPCAFESAQIDSWINFASQELAPVAQALTTQVFGTCAANPGLQQKALNDLRQLLNFLNEHLKTRTVFCGCKISIADIAVASHLHYLFQFVIDEKLRNGWVNLTRWFSFVAGQEEWKRAFGKARFCKTQWAFS